MESVPLIYFTRDAVVVHNTSEDMWIVIHSLVFDLTSFIKKRSETMNNNLRLLTQFAGKDLSWAFTETLNPLERINQYAKTLPVFPPVSEKDSEDSEFWWNAKNIIGRITAVERRIRIINTLTKQIRLMSVCEEWSIKQIMTIYSKSLENNTNYVLRKTGPHNLSKQGRLFMDKNLTDNGIIFDELERQFPPSLWLYY